MNERPVESGAYGGYGHAGGEPDPAPEARILIVDPDPSVRARMALVLSTDQYRCQTTSGVSEAMERLAAESFELVICDANADAGLELSGHIRSLGPETAVLISTERHDPSLGSLAADAGACGYVVKPFSADELRIDVANALHRRRLELENRQHRERLSELAVERTSELRLTIAELERSRRETLRRLSKAVVTRDTETGGHIERIGELAALIGARLGLSERRVELLRIASPMHDVGKIGISDRILRKPGRLTVNERREMQRHAQIGYEILAGSNAQPLDLAAEIALTHHERVDGYGYPYGLRGDEIPLEGRIAAVVDVFDALISDRVYRPAFSIVQATEIMRAGRGTHFDPEPLDALLSDARTLLAARQAGPTGRFATE